MTKKHTNDCTNKLYQIKATAPLLDFGLDFYINVYRVLSQEDGWLELKMIHTSYPSGISGNDKNYTFSVGEVWIGKEYFESLRDAIKYHHDRLTGEIAKINIEAKNETDKMVRWQKMIACLGDSEQVTTNKQIIKRALDTVEELARADGGHHKQHRIDQIVRVLTGCPTVKTRSFNRNGTAFEFKALGENERYREWVKDYEDGEDGPKTYEWDIGIP